MRIALLLVLALCGWCHGAPRNVLMMIGDDHGLDGGCFGNAAVATPNLDRLARQGTRFSNAFAAVSSCSPSRSVILTGLYNHTNGQYGLAHAVNNQVTQRWVASLPKMLNEAGYRTAIIGKNHVQPKEVYPYEISVEGPTVNRNVKNLVRRAREIMTRNDKPFFIVAGFHDPHRASKGFANDATYEGVEAKKYDPAKVKVPAHLPDDPQVRKDIADYYESVSRMDQGVGLLLGALAETEHDQDTLVIYISDNGMPFPGAKTNLYEAAIRLPLIVRAPGVKVGAVNEALVSWVDVTPTVLEWTGAKGPEYELAGKSLLGDVMKEEAVFASHTMHEVWMYYPMRAVRTEKYKLIWNLAHEQTWPVAGDIARSPSQAACERLGNVGKRSLKDYQHRPEFELYDVQSDPDEMKNLAGEPAHAATKNELLGRIKSWMKETKDPWLGHVGEEE